MQDKSKIVIEHWLTETINLLLEAPKERIIDPHKSILALGMDSMTIIQLQGAIEDKYPDAGDINTEIFLEEPTIAKLAAVLAAKLSVQGAIC